MPDAELPLPLVQASEDDAKRATFPPNGVPDPRTPQGSAYIWRSSLDDPQGEGRRAMDVLSFDSPAWGDFSDIAARLDGWQMMQIVQPAPGLPEFVRCMHMLRTSSDTSMQSFGDAPLDETRIMIMVRCPDDVWRVWGVTDSYPLPNEDILRSLLPVWGTFPER